MCRMNEDQVRRLDDCLARLMPYLVGSEAASMLEDQSTRGWPGLLRGEEGVVKVERAGAPSVTLLHLWPEDRVGCQDHRTWQDFGKCLYRSLPDSWEVSPEEWRLRHV